jgi:hypothetical protein
MVEKGAEIYNKVIEKLFNEIIAENVPALSKYKYPSTADISDLK